MEFKIENFTGRVEFNIKETISEQYKIYIVLITNFVDNELQASEYTGLKLAYEKNFNKIKYIPYKYRNEIKKYIKLKFERKNILYFDKTEIFNLINLKS